MTNITARDRALQWARDLVRENNWVAFDTETTGFDGEVIEWAVVGPDGTVLGQGYVKPTCPIEDGARLVHQITESMLTNAVDFIEAWGTIYRLLRDKIVVIYNAEFDIARLVTSAMHTKSICPRSRCLRHAAVWSNTRATTVSNVGAGGTSGSRLLQLCIS